MKRILKLFMLAALFFCAALVYAQSNDYYACRCRQWNGNNLSSLGVTLNTCCALRQSNYDVGLYFTGSGTTVGSQSGANVTCGTACPSSQVSVNGVCKTPCSNLYCPAGYQKSTNTYNEDAPGCCVQDCSYFACNAINSGAYGWLNINTQNLPAACSSCCVAGTTATLGSTMQTISCGGNTFVKCSCAYSGSCSLCSGYGGNTCANWTLHSSPTNTSTAYSQTYTSCRMSSCTGTLMYCPDGCATGYYYDGILKDCVKQ
ncbi:MAG: hypothetical protein FWF35_01810 [Elusimicrobia bacterium]|nr:hypothetical protein [Elusimicrobiota bacterium]